MIKLVGVLALSFVASPACLQHAFSPPSDAVSMDRPGLMAPGESRLGLSVGAGQVTFGPEFVDESVVYRTRLAHQELEVSAFSGQVTGRTNGNGPVLVAGRAALKGTFDASFPHLGWQVGAGVGGWAGGAYVAPDVAIILGYENPTLIPTLVIDAFASLPFATRALNVSDDTDPGTEQHFDAPDMSFGFRPQIGLALPLGAVDIHLGVGLLLGLDVTGQSYVGALGNAGVTIKL